MVNIAVIGKGKHERATCIPWDQAFPNIEEFDSLIIDLTSFPEDSLDEAVLDNIMELSKAQYTFMKTSRETFCIIDEPINFRKGTKQIKRINYVWLPQYDSLKIIRKKPGKSKTVKDKRFTKYFECVEKWNYEIQWRWVQYYNFDSICVNKSGNAIAGTLYWTLLGESGKIYLLPKTTRISVSDSVELLIDLALGKEITEYPWRREINVPRLQKIESKINSKRGKIDLIRKEIEDLKLKWEDQESYRDIFSKNDNKVPRAVQRILGDLGIRTKETPKGYVVDLISQKVAVEVTSIKGKVNAKTKKVSQLSRFIEEKRKEEKVIFVANTYKELFISERVGKEHLTETMENFLKSVHVCFITTLTLYQLWLKMLKEEMSARKVASLILKKDGILQI